MLSKINYRAISTYVSGMQEEVAYGFMEDEATQGLHKYIAGNYFGPEQVRYNKEKNKLQKWFKIKQEEDKILLFCRNLKTNKMELTQTFTVEPVSTGKLTKPALK